jgi:hypothetical protein
MENLKKIMERSGSSQDHPSREELLRYLADVEAKQNQEIRAHVSGCKRCEDQCYFLDPQLDHD